MKRLNQKFSSHLADTNKGYFEHLCGAVKASGECFIAGGAALIHGFLPFIFKTTTSDIIRRMYKKQNK